MSKFFSNFAKCLLAKGWKKIGKIGKLKNDGEREIFLARLAFGCNLL